MQTRGKWLRTESTRPVHVQPKSSFMHCAENKSRTTLRTSVNNRNQQLQITSHSLQSKHPRPRTCISSLWRPEGIDLIKESCVKSLDHLLMRWTQALRWPRGSCKPETEAQRRRVQGTQVSDGLTNLLRISSQPSGLQGETLNSAAQRTQK